MSWFEDILNSMEVFKMMVAILPGIIDKTKVKDFKGNESLVN